ncbi:hypothetical protein BUALT_Bualt15G0006400 [Buddleja alternifolia]|uniref:Major facilitator superfamily (MFS) profile domain-containing protein n=1 Tax=Buddleja alternifolia TaxID=168488 RepID=A0AAV6WMB4_9LAMI|nr:hypothetical protein BUALT_Bualt15G0006400 [Buddleja alternifolia]
MVSKSGSFLAAPPPSSGTGTASFDDISTTKYVSSLPSDTLPSDHAFSPEATPGSSFSLPDSEVQKAALQLQSLLLPPLSLSPNKLVSFVKNPSQPLALPPPPADSSPGAARGAKELFLVFNLVSFGGVTLGYHLGVSGGVSSMAFFLEEFFPEIHRNEASTNQYCKFNNQKLQLFTSSLYLAAFIASLGASWVAKKFGYRIIMIMVWSFFLLGTVFTAGAVNIAMLIGGRILVGFGIGFANQSMRWYIFEMSGHKSREYFNILFEFTILFGILQANLANSSAVDKGKDWGWRFSLGAGACYTPILIMLSFFLSSETPNSLVERGKKEEAKALLKLINYGVKANIVETEFNDMVAAMEKAQNPWGNLMKRKCFRPQLAMSILIPLFQQFTGINVIIFYAPVFFKSIGSLEREACLISTMIIVIVYLVTFGVSIYDSDRWGKKYRLLFLQRSIESLFFIGVQFMMVVLAGLAGLTILVEANIPSWLMEAVVTCICMYMMAFPWSWGAIGWFYPSEIFPLEVRSAAQSITVAINMLVAFIMGQFFLTMFCSMKFGVFIFFAFFLVMIITYCYFLMPERKNISVEAMTQVWREHWFWKRFMNDPNDHVNEASRKTQLNV